MHHCHLPGGGWKRKKIVFVAIGIRRSIVRDRGIRFAAFVVLLGLTFLSAPAGAQRQMVAGKELLAWSQQAVGTTGTGVFSGFVLGVHDAFNEIMFCTSRDVEKPQIEDAVTEFLNTHPEFLYKTAADLVRQALAESFPCQR